MQPYAQADIVSLSYIFLVGVIDLAGLFVPKQARPVGKWKRSQQSAAGFPYTIAVQFQ